MTAANLDTVARPEERKATTCSRPVLYVAPVAELGGGETVLLELAKRAQEFGYHPVFAFLRPGPLVAKARELGIETHVYVEHRYRNLLLALRGLLWIKQVAAKYPNCCIHANHAAHVYTFWAGKREIWHIYDEPAGGILGFVEQRLRSCNAIFAGAHIAEAHGSYRIDHSVVIPPTCIPFGKWNHFAGTSSILEDFSLRENQFFLTVARIQEHKGLHVLIEAIAAVLKEYPGLKCCITGKASGPEQEGYRARLVCLARECGIGDSVVFTGSVSEEGLAALFNSAKALIHPALSEGFGLVILDAMSMGLPVIVTDAKGPSSIVRAGVDGWVVRRGSVRSLADGILDFLRQPLKVEGIVASARHRCREFSYEQFVTRTFAFYNEVFSRSERVARLGKLGEVAAR